ncbi:MAG: Lrp/AsnC family transcriptional regulator [Gammaproteobacteria bacterium]|nr:Lrp/AsnC family transcriptional regulator [Gammaproteobacteria bacterium]
MDEKDKEILYWLQKNGRMSIAELAEKVSLSDTPCIRRVKKLEQEGIISGYSAVVSAKGIGLNVLIYAFVKLQANSDKNAEQFEQQVQALDNVLECSVISGGHDYLLKIVARDLEDYEAFVKKSLGKIDAISGIESTVVLKQNFAKTSLPL